MVIDKVRKYCVCVGLACLLGSYAQAADTGPRVLATWGDVQVTDEDIERYLRFKLPDRDPAELIARPGALENYIQTLLMVRTLGGKSRRGRSAAGRSAGLAAAQSAQRMASGGLSAKTGG